MLEHRIMAEFTHTTVTTARRRLPSTTDDAAAVPVSSAPAAETMPRRLLLALTAMALPGDFISDGLAAAGTSPTSLAPQVADAAPDPDAELARWCGVYVAACAAYNADASADDDNPLWDAIMEAEAEIDARPPVALSGVLAKAWMAIDIAGQEPEERSDWGSSAAGRWAREVVLDLARLYGEGRA
jgi:hypothetical protein